MQKTNTDYSDIDVKIQISIGGKKNAAYKRIKAPENLQELKDALTSFAAKQDITQPIVQIMYKDKNWVDVADEDDFQLGMNQIQKFSKTKAVTFVGSYEKSVNPDLEEKKQAPQDKQVREKKITRKQLREMQMKEDGVEFQTPGEGEDARKRSRSERRRSKNPRTEDGVTRGKTTPKRERFDRRMNRDFMKMVNAFLVKTVGKEEQEKMKHEFYQIMKEGTEEQK